MPKLLILPLNLKGDDGNWLDDDIETNTKNLLNKEDSGKWEKFRLELPFGSPFVKGLPSETITSADKLYLIGHGSMMVKGQAIWKILTSSLMATPKLCDVGKINLIMCNIGDTAQSTFMNDFCKFLREVGRFRGHVVAYDTKIHTHEAGHKLTDYQDIDEKTAEFRYVEVEDHHKTIRYIRPHAKLQHGRFFT